MLFRVLEPLDQQLRRSRECHLADEPHPVVANPGRGLFGKPPLYCGKYIRDRIPVFGLWDEVFVGVNEQSPFEIAQIVQ